MTWGLDPEALSVVQKYAAAEETMELTGAPDETPEGVLLVGPNVWPDFVSWAKTLETSEGIRPQPVLLFLSDGAAEPAGGWDYRDGIFSASDPGRLLTLLSCENIIQAELAAAEVPAAFLQELQRPVSVLRAAEFPFGDSEWDQPDSEIRAQLADCVYCRRAFNAALESRSTSFDRIMIQATEAPRRKWEFVIKARAKLNAPVPAPLAILSALAADPSFQPSIRSRGPVAHRGVNEQDEDLTALIQSEATGLQENDIALLTKRLAQGLLFESDIHYLKAQARDDAFVLSSLLDTEGNPIREYLAELLDADTTVWSMESREGEVMLPLSELERIIARGEVRLIISWLAKEERAQ